MSVTSKPRILLDTNILIHAFIDITQLTTVEYDEQVRSKIARQIFFDTNSIKIILDFQLQVEIPRVLTKFILKYRLVSPTKLAITINYYKNIERIIDELRELDITYKLSIWDTPEILRRAAGLWNRHLNKAGREPRHQDIIILAATQQTKAILITTDINMDNYIKTLELDIPAYIIQIDKIKRKTSVISRPKQPVPIIEQTLKQLQADQ